MDIRSYLNRPGIERLKYWLYLVRQKLPPPISYLTRDLIGAIKAVRLQQAMREEPFTALQKLERIAQIALGREKTVLFYPQMPGSHHKAKTLCALSGFKIVNDPGRYYDVSVQFWDKTKVSRKNIEDDLDINRSINGESLDISKKKVAETFEKVFGYSLGIDPQSYSGLAVEKSNKNGTHDGTVIECPIPDSAVEEAKVYEKFIRTSTEDGFHVNYRVAVCGGLVPIVLVMYRPPDNRFDGTSHQEIAPLEDVFTRSERQKMAEFIRAMNLDYGEVDVLRDNDDGRIYVVDVNNTPGISDAGEHAGQMADYKITWRRTLANEFEKMVREFDEEPP